MDPDRIEQIEFDFKDCGWIFEYALYRNTTISLYYRQASAMVMASQSRHGGEVLSLISARLPHDFIGKDINEEGEIMRLYLDAVFSAIGSNSPSTTLARLAAAEYFSSAQGNPDARAIFHFLPYAKNFDEMLTIFNNKYKLVQ